MATEDRRDQGQGPGDRTVWQPSGKDKGGPKAPPAPMDFEDEEDQEDGTGSPARIDMSYSSHDPRGPGPTRAPSLGADDDELTRLRRQLSNAEADREEAVAAERKRLMRRFWIGMGILALLALVGGPIGGLIWHLSTRPAPPPDLTELNPDKMEEFHALGEDYFGRHEVEIKGQKVWGQKPELEDYESLVYVTRPGEDYGLDLVVLRQNHEESEATDEVLRSGLHWLDNNPARDDWPMQDDLEICKDRELLGWIEVSAADGMSVTTTVNTASPGEPNVSITDVKGGAYLCVVKNEGKDTYRLESRVYNPLPPESDWEVERIDDGEGNFTEKPIKPERTIADPVVIVPELDYDLHRAETD